MDIRSLIEKVLKNGGRELHLKIGSKPLMRKNMALKQMDFPSIIEADMEAMLKDLLTKDEIAKFLKQGVYESNHIGEPPCNFRLSLFHSQQKPVAYIKLINASIPTLKDIEFPEALASQLAAPKGLFILSGPSRSGISISLAALVEHMNLKYRRHILIIEDPIEFNYESKQSVISQRQFSKDILLVEQAVNFSKRMDVDTLVIGDLNRGIPFRNIIEYVAGGHLVLLCVQALGVTNTLEKLVYSFSEEYREYVNQVLAENLLGVCSQYMVVNSNGSSVPVREILLPSKSSAGIISMGKYSQLDANISTASLGSILFETDIAEKVTKGKLEKAAAESFLEYYRGLKA